MSYQDRALTCVDCSQSFTFSAEDQQYHADKGFTNEPKRCPSCRAAKRSQRNSGDSGGYGFRERVMHPAVCAQCGKETEVPFQPRGDRPVYCSDCYRQQPGARNSR
jgi:CxxC-x17-CxxC domain-containing protein